MSEHGLAAYRRGCRCADCRAAVSADSRARYLAHAEERRAYRRKRYAQNKEACKAIRSASSAKAQSETLERATRRGQPWTGPELEMALNRPDLTTRQVALMIGRTANGVKNIRRSAAKDVRKTGEPWAS